MAARDVDVVVHHDTIERLLTSDDTRAMLQATNQPVVQDARARAPKATGQGAFSIHTEMILTTEEWQALTSWDQEHYYMYFHERGTRQLPAQPFLVPALRAAAR